MDPTAEPGQHLRRSIAHTTIDFPDKGVRPGDPTVGPHLWGIHDIVLILKRCIASLSLPAFQERSHLSKVEAGAYLATCTVPKGIEPNRRQRTRAHWKW
jgi:hypothetical protein